MTESYQSKAISPKRIYSDDVIAARRFADPGVREFDGADRICSKSAEGVFAIGAAHAVDTVARDAFPHSLYLLPMQ